MEANFSISIGRETEQFVMAWTNAPVSYDYDDLVISLRAIAEVPDTSALASRRDQIGEVRFILIPVSAWNMQTSRYRSGLYVAEPLSWESIRDYRLQTAVWDKLYRNTD